MGRRDLCSELNATKIVFQVVNCLRFTLFFKADEMMLDCNSMKSCILKIYHEANITRGYFAVFSLLDGYIMSTWKIFHFETKPWRKQVKFFLIWEGARKYLSTAEASLLNVMLTYGLGIAY